jgi:hypothetical protein
MGSVIVIMAVAGVVASTISYLIGHENGVNSELKRLRENEEARKKNLRRGILKLKNFYWHEAKSVEISPRVYTTKLVGKEADLVVVEVRELDRIADQSRVEIIGADGAPLANVRKRIGNYWETNDISWEERPEPIQELKSRLSREEQIIMTPLHKLADAVIEDKIE